MKLQSGLNKTSLFEQNFLEQEHSNENIEFWNACQEYKSLCGKEARKKADQIYKTYFKSDHKINIDAKARGDVQTNYHKTKSGDLPTNLFDVAQAQVGLQKTVF